MKETQLQYLKRQFKCKMETLRIVNVNSSTWRELGDSVIDFLDAFMNYEEEKLREEED